MGEIFFIVYSIKAFPLIDDFSILVLGVFRIQFLAAAVAGVDQALFL